MKIIIFFLLFFVFGCSGKLKVNSYPVDKQVVQNKHIENLMVYTHKGVLLPYISDRELSSNLLGFLNQYYIDSHVVFKDKEFPKHAIRDIRGSGEDIFNFSLSNDEDNFKTERWLGATHRLFINPVYNVDSDYKTYILALFDTKTSAKVWYAKLTVKKGRFNNMGLKLSHMIAEILKKDGFELGVSGDFLYRTMPEMKYI